MQIEVISGGKRLTMWVLAAAQYGWHYRHDDNSLYSYIEGLAELKNAFKSCPFTSKILEQCLSRRQRTIEEKDIFWGLPHQKWCSTEIRVRVSLSQAWNNFKLLETIKSVQIALAQSSPPDKFLRPSKRWAPRPANLLGELQLPMCELPTSPAGSTWTWTAYRTQPQNDFLKDSKCML